MESVQKKDEAQLPPRCVAESRSLPYEILACPFPQRISLTPLTVPPAFWHFLIKHWAFSIKKGVNAQRRYRCQSSRHAMQLSYCPACGRCGLTHVIHVRLVWYTCGLHVSSSFIWLILWRCLHEKNAWRSLKFSLLSSRVLLLKRLTGDRVWAPWTVSDLILSHLKKTMPRFNHSIQFFIRKCWQNASSHYVWKVIKVYTSRKSALPGGLWPRLRAFLWASSEATRAPRSDMKQMLRDFFCCALLPHSPRLHGAKRGTVFFQKNSAKTRSPDSFRFLVGEIPSSEFVSFESQLSQTWFTRIEDNWQMAWWHDDGMMMVWYGLGRKVSDDINMLECDGKNKQKAHRKDISRAWKTVTLRLSILSILSTCPFFSANSRRKFKSFRHIVMTAWLHDFMTACVLKICLCTSFQFL